MLQSWWRDFTGVLFAPDRVLEDGDLRLECGHLHFFAGTAILFMGLLAALYPAGLYSGFHGLRYGAFLSLAFFLTGCATWIALATACLTVSLALPDAWTRAWATAEGLAAWFIAFGPIGILLSILEAAGSLISAEIDSLLLTGLALASLFRLMNRILGRIWLLTALRIFVGAVVVGWISGISWECSPWVAWDIHRENMSPTLRVGDSVRVNQATLLLRPPYRGELVVYRPPFQKRAFLFGRVIGLPGERVEFRGKNVHIDGQLLAEPWAHWVEPPRDPEKEPSKYFKPNRYSLSDIPVDCYYILGDNRSNSLDGRYFEAVHRDLLQGLVFYRYLPVSRRGPLGPRPADQVGWGAP